MKKCRICGIHKNENDFYKSGVIKDGRLNTCICCHKEKRRIYLKSTHNLSYHKYEKTINGFLMRLYRNMSSRINGIQKKKFHLYCGKELLSKDLFYEWAKNDNSFIALYDIWEKSGYSRKLTPSVDRIDSSKGYVLNNMEWVTHSENSRRGAVNKNKMHYNIG